MENDLINKIKKGMFIGYLSNNILGLALLSVPVLIIADLCFIAINNGLPLINL